jgi:hypothetical protein
MIELKNIREECVSLALFCLCAVLMTEFYTSCTSVGSYLTEHISHTLYRQGCSDKKFITLEIYILIQDFVHKLCDNDSLATVRHIRCLFTAGFLLTNNIIRRRSAVKPVAWLLLLLMSAGDIHLNSGHTLRCNGQSDIRSCLCNVFPTITASDGHCLLAYRRALFCEYTCRLLL